MKQEWADKWVAALLSGNFPQGKGRLRTEKGGFCVLGVLCFLAGEVPVPGRDTKDLGKVYHYGPDADDVCLPRTVMKLTGMHSSRGYLEDREVGVLSLAALNDGGMPFQGLAHFIKTNAGVL
jgi:hypothetical protein